MNKFLDWLDHRTGARGIARAALFEHIPGGARWRYVWGSAVTFAIVVQIITGIVLLTAYSANAQGAWESVFYIQNEMLGGWVLRGIHHWTAQVLTVLLVLHLLQVVIDGAYKAPREVNFWFGLLLLFVVFGLSLTGYLLPWDQKGYWATKVATSIASVTPLIGPQLKELMVGGPDYGHHTLTRFLGLHAGVLPGVLITLIVAHVYLFRRHGITAKQPFKKPDTTFWPDQVFRDAVACLAVMAAVMILVVWHHGAELGAPADPTEPYSAARPEWTFLFLYQGLKYFPAGMEVVGAILIPGLVVTVVALMPIIAHKRRGHQFNLALVAVLLAGAGILTTLAVTGDRADAEFARAKTEAEETAERAVALAEAPSGIPATGALSLLRQDPMVQGPRIFASTCANCHTYDGHDGQGVKPTDPPSAPDLKGYGSRAWLEGLLDKDSITSPAYFGGTEHTRGRMARFVTRAIPRFSDEQKAELQKVIKALSAEAQLPGQAAQDSADMADIVEGRQLIASDDIHCTSCHTFHGQGDEDSDGPNLTGWGSKEWMLGMLQNPSHPQYYGDDNDRMPSFGDDQILTPAQMEMVVDWLRHDWYEPVALRPSIPTKEAMGSDGN